MAPPPPARGLRRVPSEQQAHVGKDEVFEVELVDRPRRVEDRLVGRTTSVLCRSVWLAPMTSREGAAVAPRGGQSMVRAKQLVDVAGDLDAGADEHNEVVKTRSRSATRCEERTTLTPCSTTTSIRPWRNSRRASGSRLATGSSSTSSSGRFATAG